MWTKISSYGHLERSKVLLAAFEESQQMRTAKIEFTGEPLDSLVDDPLKVWVVDYCLREISLSQRLMGFQNG